MLLSLCSVGARSGSLMTYLGKSAKISAFSELSWWARSIDLRMSLQSYVAVLGKA